VLTYSFRSGLDQPVSREAVFLDGPHRVLLVGGYLGATRSPGAAVETFDTAAGRVQPDGSIETPLAEAATVDLRGADLLLGGSDMPGTAQGVSTATARVLRIVSRPVGGGGVVAAPLGSLPAARSGAGAAVLGSRAFVVGGYDGTTSLPTVLATSDGRHFSIAADLVEAVRYPAVAAFDGQVLVIGGEVVQSGVPEPVDEVQAVTPGKRLARVVARLPQAVSGAAAWVVSGRLFVAGGDSELSQTGTGVITSDAVWVYDRASREFSLAGYLSLPVSHAGTVVDGDDVLVLGGESQGTAVTTVQEVVPVR
jgi:hypothetical protein